MIIITSFEKKAKSEEIPQIKKNKQDNIGQNILRNLAINYNLNNLKNSKKSLTKPSF